MNQPQSVVSLSQRSDEGEKRLVFPAARRMKNQGATELILIATNDSGQERRRGRLVSLYNEGSRFAFFGEI